MKTLLLVGLVLLGARLGRASCAAPLRHGSFPYTYRTSHVGGDPGSGAFKFSTALQNTGNAVFRVSETDGDAIDISGIMDVWDNALPLSPSAVLWMLKDGDPSAYAIWGIGAVPLDNGPWRSYAVRWLGAGGVFNDGDAVTLFFSLAGASIGQCEGGS